MAYRALKKFDNALPLSRFEISRPTFIDGAVRLAGETIPSVKPHRLRQLYEARRIRVAETAQAANTERLATAKPKLGKQSR